MAYLIAKNDSVYFIASNETRRDLSNQFNTTVIDISDSNFESLRKGLSQVSISGNTATFTAVTDFDSKWVKDADELQTHFDSIIDKIDSYTRNNSNDLATALKSYKSYMNSFDKSSLTYPMNWEQYCDDNSVTFFNYIEIP